MPIMPLPMPNKILINIFGFFFFFLLQYSLHCKFSTSIVTHLSPIINYHKITIDLSTKKKHDFNYNHPFNYKSK